MGLQTILKQNNSYSSESQMASTSLHYVLGKQTQSALRGHISRTITLQVIVGKKTNILSTIRISCKFTFSLVEQHPLGQFLCQRKI